MGMENQNNTRGVVGEGKGRGRDKGKDVVLVYLNV